TATVNHHLGPKCQASPGTGHTQHAASCSEFLYLIKKGVPLARAAAHRRPVTAARSCLPPRWRRPPATRRAVAGKRADLDSGSNSIGPQRRRRPAPPNAAQHHVRPRQRKAAIVVGVPSKARAQIEQPSPLPSGQAGAGRML
ncbi:hypothetical protein, partial [Streptomyces griseoruber]|uniref:hypothetical protein n=1 Tax=Streptomyces griseoruber TaxID=1943 RepID=UPI0019817453